MPTVYLSLSLSLQVEYVVKEKNAKILQLEQEKLVQSVKLERLKERLAQMERLGGGGGSSPLGGGGSDAASLTALQQKDGEMLALQVHPPCRPCRPCPMPPTHVLLRRAHSTHRCRRAPRRW